MKKQEIIDFIKCECSLGSVVIRRKSEKLNLTSTFKVGQEVTVLGFKGKVHLILGRGTGRGKRKGEMNYLVEMKKDIIAPWDMSKRERKRYGCHLEKDYKITLEKWMK